MKLSTTEWQEYEAYIKEWRNNYTAIVGNYNKGKIEINIEIVTNMHIY